MCLQGRRARARRQVGAWGALPSINAFALVQCCWSQRCTGGVLFVWLAAPVVQCSLVLLAVV